MLRRLGMLGVVVLWTALVAPASAQSADALIASVNESARGCGGDVATPLLTRSGTLTEGQTRNLQVALRANQCFVAVAKSAAEIANIDIQVARGRTVVTRDTETGTTANATYCAGVRPERIQVRVTAFRGRGEFAAGVFATSGPSNTSPAPPANASAATATPLDRVAERARGIAASMQPVTPVTRESLNEGQRIERDLALVPGRCYRVVSASDDSVQDVDLSVLAPNGGELQRDGTAVRDAELGAAQPLCPAAPGTHRLVLRVARGHGTVVWQLLGSATTPNSPTGTRTPVARAAVGGAGTDFIATRIRSRHHDAGERGVAVEDVVRGELTTSLSRDFEVTAEAGRCYIVLAAGVPSVRELDLKVFDSLGNELARDGERDAFPRARFCPTIAGRFRVNVRMFQGYGPYGVQVFEVP